MKYGILALTAFAIAAPALAQTAAPPSDTIKAILEKGVTMTVMGYSGEIEYKADGTYSGFDGQATGTYTVDGTKMCSTSDMGTGCAEYPVGKKPGDAFKIAIEGIGEVEIAIRQ